MRKGILTIIAILSLSSCSFIPPRTGSGESASEPPRVSSLSEYISATFVTGDGATQYKEQVISRGSKFTDPGVPSKPGCNFDGWYSDPDYTTPFDFDEVPERNYVIYAKWIEVTYSYYLYGFVDGTEYYTAEARTLSKHRLTAPNEEDEEAGAVACLYNIHLLRGDRIFVNRVGSDGETRNYSHRKTTEFTPGYYDILLIENEVTARFIRQDDWVIELRTPHSEGDLHASFVKDHSEGNDYVYLASGVSVHADLKLVLVLAYSGNYQNSKFTSTFSIEGFGENYSNIVTWSMITDPVLGEGYHQAGIEFHVETTFDITVKVHKDLSLNDDLTLTFARSGMA